METLNTDYAVERQSRFWNDNLQKIEELHQEIVLFLKSLDKSYESFDEIYGDLKKRIDVFASIYSGYNTINGREQVLQLKATVDSYRKKYTKESIDLPHLESLMSHIGEMRKRSFEQFPLLYHCAEKHVTADTTMASREKFHYRWITFKENGSWFVTPFNELSIREPCSYSIISRENHDWIIIRYDLGLVRVRTFFQRADEDPDNNSHVLIINGGEKNFLTQETGRKIYARADFMNSMITPFKSQRGFSVTPGRVKLFGKNHIFIP